MAKHENFVFGLSLRSPFSIFAHIHRLIMELAEAIRQRHSVRRYTDKPIPTGVTDELKSLIEECNRSGDLNMQLVLDEPRAFGGRMARYGSFSGVRNYLALVGPKGPSLDERCGYYGEHIVLRAQQLGLNTCWVGLTYTKVPEAVNIDRNEKLVAVIAIGYGETQGVQHKSKPVSKVVRLHGNEPDWFMRGVEYALLAPTALNQQKFLFEYADGKVSAKTRWGFYADIDLGIAKYHFEIGSGTRL